MLASREVMSRATPQTPPAELVAKILSGDRRAEEALFERYRRGIATILRQTLGSRAVAEDLFQETFRLALEKVRAGELRDPERLPQFLNSLARNLAIDYFRKNTRRGTDEPLESVDHTLEIEPSQYAQLARREKGQLALEVLRQLGNDRYRQLLYRYYIAEEEKASLCADFDLSSLHFNRVLFRARQHYRELFLKVIGARERQSEDSE